MRGRRLFLALAAPLGAILFAGLLSSIFLVISGNNPLTAYAEMFKFGIFSDARGIRWDSIISSFNRAIPLYFSALAVAVGFKMGLFNIGVEGQYKIAALFAAYIGAAVTLPSVIHVPFILLVGMAIGAIWAGIAGALKVYRGVHEVISTIMLNFIATGLAAYLLATYFRQENEPGDLVIKTKEIPESGLIPSLNPVLDFLNIDPGSADLQGFLVAAIAAGIIYHLLINRTRFGFDLRSTGLNPGAAEASGVDPGNMVIKAMLIGGAIAGLVGMSQLLGFFDRYTIDFPTMLGFDGIAVALLGRNHPVGMAAGALLIGFLERSAQILDLKDIPKEVVQIMIGIVILSVVVAYEIVGRRARALEVEAAAQATAEAAGESNP